LNKEKHTQEIFEFQEATPFGFRFSTEKNLCEGAFLVYKKSRKRLLKVSLAFTSFHPKT